MAPSAKLRFDSQLLRAGIALVWLATGLLVLHPAYREVGSFYLHRLGLPDWLMFVTCGLEVLLGLRVLLGPAATWLAILQAAMILGFTAILAFLDPMLLVHPFGYLTKNVPLLAMIGTAWLLEREGWSVRAYWLLRAGIGLIWISEGLLPKVLFQQETELRLVAESGLMAGDPGDYLFWLGLAEAASGVAVLMFPPRLMRIILACQIAALVVLPLAISWQHPELWLHPFGGMTKTVAILIGSIVLIRGSLATVPESPRASC